MHHLNRIRKNQTTSLQSHYHQMPSLYLTKELTSSPPLPLPASLLSKKLSLPKSTQLSVHSFARRTTPPVQSQIIKHHKVTLPFPSLQQTALSTSFTTNLVHQEQSRPHFNLHLIDYVHNIVSFTKEFLQPVYFDNVQLFIPIYPTCTYTPHLTLHTYRTTMTSYLQ